MRGGMQLGSMLPPSHRTIDSHAFENPGGLGAGPRSREAPFLFCIRFLEKVLGQKESPRIVAWGLKDPCVINHFVQELINGNRSEEEPTIKFNIHTCENRYRSIASNGTRRLQPPGVVRPADLH